MKQEPYKDPVIAQIPSKDALGDPDGRVSTIITSTQAEAAEIQALFLQWAMQVAKNRSKA